MKPGEEKFVVITALLAGLLLGAGQTIDGEPASVLVSYIYWILRVLVEAGLFFAILLGFERYLSKGTPFSVTVGLAILFSHLIFVPMITAIDIVLGFPELGIGSTDPAGIKPAAAFGWELVYLLDNHIFLCLLLCLPRFLGKPAAAQQNEIAQNVGDGNASNRLIDRLSPPLSGKVQWIEAQEHYVRIITDEEVRMELCRFSDIVADLSAEEGMQTHRSHWVSHSAIESHRKDGQSLQLILHSGDVVPVSRSHRAAVLEWIENSGSDQSAVDFPTSL